MNRLHHEEVSIQDLHYLGLKARGGVIVWRDPFLVMQLT